MARSEPLPRTLGAYRPIAVLATGGMATLYLAEEKRGASLQRLVVIKRVHPHLAADVQFRDMFLDEARVASRIRHPNVVPLLSVVDHDDETMLVLEYVESLPLSRVLSKAREAGIAIPPRV